MKAQEDGHCHGHHGVCSQAVATYLYAVRVVTWQINISLF
jgi:hypothetical protein